MNFPIHACNQAEGVFNGTFKGEGHGLSSVASYTLPFAKTTGS